MNDTYYFSHDYNARLDLKIKNLIRKHGYLGYGIFWALIEDLYNNANALLLEYESIAFDLRIDEIVVKSIINDFGLFVVENGNFSSSSVENRLNKRAEKSQKAKESALQRWNKNANALRTQSDSNAIKERKGKEKEIERETEEVFRFEVFYEDYKNDRTYRDTIAAQQHMEPMQIDYAAIQYRDLARKNHNNYKNFNHLRNSFKQWLLAGNIPSKQRVLDHIKRKNWYKDANEKS